jgi:hypothetical protein
MPTYKVLYLKDQAAIDRFRAQPPPDGVTSIKAKDYEQVATIDAPHEYAVWRMLQGEDSAQQNVPRQMGVGDVLEIEGAKPRVCRFSGFDDAAWWVFQHKAKTTDESGQEPAPEASV